MATKFFTGKRLPFIKKLLAVSLLLMQGCAIDKYYDSQHPEKHDNRAYAASQEALQQLDVQQLETLQELKKRVDVGTAPCVEQYRPMYAEGYATGYAYFTLTKNWFHSYSGIAVASAQNAYIAGWLEGQIHARSEWEARK